MTSGYRKGADHTPKCFPGDVAESGWAARLGRRRNCSWEAFRPALRRPSRRGGRSACARRRAGSATQGGRTSALLAAARRVVAVAVRPVVLLIPLAAGVTAFLLRDPERVIARRPEVALAPADGRVIHVDRVWDAYWRTELLEIGVFLALWDVHVQRSPLDGEVVARHRRAGGYRPATSRAATHGNNQLATYVRTGGGPCVITQISGLLARRIVNWAAPGTRLAQGERVGMIRLGSQTTLRLPATATVLVKVGDRVRAGLTPVAHLETNASPDP